MSELSHTTTDRPQVLAELTTIILGEKPLNPTLQRIADIARRAVPRTDEVSVTLIGKGDRPRTVVFTASLAVDLDERQYAAGFGPCLDAAVAADTVVVDVADPDTPYPDFAAVSRRAGVRHVVSLGLPVQYQVSGALNMYSRQAEPHDEAALALAKTVAAYAGAVVANAAQYDSAAELAAQMQQALSSRAVIEQAKGILMAHHGCSSEVAFRRLTRISQHSNRKLRDVAADLVATVSNGRGGTTGRPGGPSPASAPE
ncbi:MAG TPA: ANTAR domain-containing protein [Propionibacteriaceae bacterium]|nr:ANTAR domain-containing protein [Propionibacteriaceae bacterium]